MGRTEKKVFLLNGSTAKIGYKKAKKTSNSKKMSGEIHDLIEKMGKDK